MIFKVPAHRGKIGDPLDMYSVNCDISPNQPLFRKGRKKIRLLLGCGDYGLDLESSEFVGGQIMRQSESKGQKMGVVCERIELITTVKIQEIVKWAEV